MTLIIDTSTEVALVAFIVQDELKKVIWNADLRHSEELLPKIFELCAQNNLKIKNLKGIIVIAGPGSFTGLRVGITCANALKFALNIPVVGINKLDWLAWLLRVNIHKAINICSVIRIWSDQIFVGFYKSQPKAFKLARVKRAKKFFVGSFSQLDREIKEPSFFVCGDKVLAKQIKNLVKKKVLEIKTKNLFTDQSLRILFEIGSQKLAKSKIEEIVLPVYMRKPHITKHKDRITI